MNNKMLGKSKYKITNDDCLKFIPKIPTEYADLIIVDPPFGIDEVSFDKHYARKSDHVIKGYTSAPKNYKEWCKEWIGSSKKILKKNGTMYIFSGWSKLNDILNAIEEHDLYILNHLIWHFNFGVFTQKKFVSSHYHILRVGKQKHGQTFNTNCRFGPQEKDVNGKSEIYKDLQDVMIINKEYSPGTEKNQNKLPDSIVEKLILYSSNADDIVCDFFLGNFTTAYCSINLKRKFIGCEINKHTYDIHLPKIKKLKYGNYLNKMKKVIVIKPKNAGKKISEEERTSILTDFETLMKKTKLKKDVIALLCDKYGRGKFSINRILKSEMPEKKVILEFID